MAAVANRASVGGAIGFLCWSFSLIRALSTSSSTSSSSSGAAHKPKRRKKKHLFEVAHFLPNWGIGYKMAKSHWRDVSDQITKINLYEIQGRLTSCSSPGKDKWCSETGLEVYSRIKEETEHPVAAEPSLA